MVELWKITGLQDCKIAGWEDGLPVDAKRGNALFWNYVRNI